MSNRERGINEERSMLTNGFLNELMVRLARIEEKVNAADNALVLARESLTRWQTTSNEWRQENIDQRAEYLTIEKGNSLINIEGAARNALEARVRILEQTSIQSSGKSQGSNSVIAIIFTIITIIISATALVIHLR